jgi:hypothetical protein
MCCRCAGTCHREGGRIGSTEGLSEHDRHGELGREPLVVRLQVVKEEGKLVARDQVVRTGKSACSVNLSVAGERLEHFR